MIRALLVVWSLDPSGAGTVAVNEFPSLAACYVRAGTVDTTKFRVTCLYTPEQNGELFETLRHCEPMTPNTYVCRGKK